MRRAEILIAVELLAKLPGILAFVFHFPLTCSPLGPAPAGQVLPVVVVVVLVVLVVAAAQTLQRTLIRSCHARRARARAPESCLLPAEKCNMYATQRGGRV